MLGGGQQTFGDGATLRGCGWGPPRQLAAGGGSRPATTWVPGEAEAAKAGCMPAGVGGRDVTAWLGGCPPEVWRQALS